MNEHADRKRFHTVIVGGGQAGLSVGYFLAQHGVPFVILDANRRIGDAWRNRWDSLRLFTPARYNELVGLRFPGRWDAFTTKDEMADYLEEYARHFALPVRTGILVERLTRRGDHFELHTNDDVLESENVVVAMATYQQPRLPTFARDLATHIRQLHSSEYRNPSQLREGAVLVVGAGHSGGDIAFDVAGRHPTLLSGRDVGQFPFRIDGAFSRYFFIPVVLRNLSHHVMTMSTPIGRRIRPRFLTSTPPLVRTRRSDLAAAGVEFVPRVIDVRDGRPLLEDGRVADVSNVVWCTGYQDGFSWIDLPIHGELEPKHERGVVPTEPGLYFVGLKYLYAASSSMLLGVGRDAKRIADIIARRSSGPDKASPVRASHHEPLGARERVSA